MLTIVCLGDSITGAPDLAHYLKWPHILDLMIEAHSGVGQARVVNRGIGGDTTAGMLARLDREVLGERPGLVILLAGGNDAGQQVPRAATAANLDAIATAVTASGARLVGLQYHLVPHPGHEAEAWQHLPTNNDLLANAVRNHAGTIADTASAMAAGALAQPAAELVGVDGVHLNPGGELIFARTVFGALRRDGLLPIPPGHR